MPSSRFLCRAATVGLAMLCCIETACAQFTVEVRDATTGSLIDAKIKVRSGSNERFLGRTNGRVLKSTDSCEGLLVSASPIFPMYQSQDDDELWKPCVPVVSISLEPLLITSAVHGMATTDAAQAKFTAYPEISARISEVSQAAEGGEHGRVSTLARDVATLLEEKGFATDAKRYWAVSAQSALFAIARQQGVAYDGNGLQSVDRQVTFTDEATNLVRSYQVAKGLPAVGVIGPKTFTEIQNISSATP